MLLCTWEGRKDDLHYTDHQWEIREARVVGEHSIDFVPLVDAADVATFAHQIGVNQKFPHCFVPLKPRRIAIFDRIFQDSIVTE